ncbi:DNA-directed RNA polymerase III subunit rpc1 [Neolecta irregularis DAH-3]|uniref:DNA-directed RNA polymerase subunit n=1 Tax=Neolecta irregularis (strain DAH-3) TaxID=1198029 RepID=A0A1U7LP41_NEOID|nr:DNA-directed RNA polymerase III subunit rpc1 [Neolecta irregularis DAH-3]|eukprot:OLL24291.1 DNA-directed RNA polymerase III subunit rpc1 [Neolecta irregularis DAH-3]
MLLFEVLSNDQFSKHIQFGVFAPKDIVKNGSVEVSTRDLYRMEDRAPQAHGALDRRMGTSDKLKECETCGEKMADCVGHFGHVKLALPAFHIGYFKATLTILQNICKDCSGILLDEDERRKHLRDLRRKGIDNLRRQQICKKINESCKKMRRCIHCNAVNGVVKKAGALKIIHEKFRHVKKGSPEDTEFRKSFDQAVQFMPDLKHHLGKAHDDLNAIKVLNLFKQIKTTDCELLGLDPNIGRPEALIWQYIPAPPVCIRPSVAQDGATTEDDLTVKLAEIVWTSSMIKAALDKGTPISNLMEQWEFMQLSIAMYINSEMPGIPLSQQASKPIRGFCQRLKGKTGRFRGNLSGKRVDFSARTVIGPDPNLRIDQVAVPERIAKILTYPEKVTEYNIKRLRLAVINGTDIHPGANYLVGQSDGFKRFLKFGDRPKIAANLRIGDIVERHLHDGDIVLFNRQPSLHKLSIMSHFAKVRPWRTFRLNECVCNPYNADFDGDEMNMHLPQTEEARAEAMELMGVKNNLVTPKNGEPIIAAIQDFITASYLISKKDVFYDRKTFTQICSFLADANLHIQVPPPTIWKPVALWTGKQIFNILMRPNSKSPILVNLDAKCKTFHPPEPGLPPDMSPNDGYLIIRNSEVMCGVMDKATVGDGKKNSVFYVILRDYGALEAANAMNRLAKLCARWLGNQGFSIGINDVQPGRRLRDKKDELVETAYRECDNLIRLLQQGKLECQPGFGPEDTLEAKVSGVLSKVRDDVGSICMGELPKTNAPLIMATCGSKGFALFGVLITAHSVGSVINVSQMVACVGQQIIAGSRVPNGFHNRSLPHFPKNSKTPPSKGFVRNSFYTGLHPTEFLFHAISGREGLVDTAVKTAETGYMSRRLMKSLEDLSAQYDGTVRTSNGGIVQFTYGADGLDPTYLEGNGRPVEFVRTWNHALAISKNTTERPLLPFEIIEVTEMYLVRAEWIRNCKTDWINTVREFIHDKVAQRLEKIRIRKGLIGLRTRPFGEEYEDINLDEFSEFEARRVVNNLLTVTHRNLDVFFTLCWEKYMKAKVEPGTAVGAIGAQSIGEPGTQMTLKTFHFAGVASMNVTLGVPRIKEIINAAKTISTPIIKCKLVHEDDVRSARVVKGRIEKTFLGDIAAYVEDVYGPQHCYVGVRIDWETIRKLQLEITLTEISHAIVRAPKLKIKIEKIQLVQPDRIRIYVDKDKDDEEVYYKLQHYKRSLPDIIVKGYSQIARAVINDEKGKKQLLIEGYGLRDVMNTEGVVGEKTYTNHVMEMKDVLGIEAARNSIINEINTTMTSHGMNIDPRHMMLLGDVMTYKGEVLGITRFGVAKMRDSVLMLASFEKTTDHLFDAAFYHKKDAIEGVSECIIMGVPMPMGTGLFKLIRRTEGGGVGQKKLLFDDEEKHVNRQTAICYSSPAAAQRKPSLSAAPDQRLLTTRPSYAAARPDAPASGPLAAAAAPPAAAPARRVLPLLLHAKHLRWKCHLLRLPVRRRLHPDLHRRGLCDHPRPAVLVLHPVSRPAQPVGRLLPAMSRLSVRQVGQATGTALPTPLSSPAPAAQTPPPVASPTILPSALPTPLPTTDLPAAPVVVSATAAPISLTPATDLTTNRSAAGALGVHDPPTPTNTTTIKPSSFFSNKAAVIGVFAIAAVAIVTIAGALFFLLLRRRRSRSASPRSHSSSFSDDRRSSIPVLANEKGEFFPIPIDQRLDALRSLQMTLENHSRKSLRDEEDYSRRLQVRNGSPGDNDFGD